MASARVIIFLSLFGISMFTCCIEPYDPHVENPPDSYLVVNVAVGDAEAVIRLTRSQAVNSEELPEPETGAQVTIETESGTSYSLTEQQAGRYTSSGMNLTTTDKCRLKITTADSKEYESVYVPVLFTPAIDSISWDTDADGLNLYVNTHDPANNTRFYMWEFEETAQYQSAYQSNYIYNTATDTVELRTEKNDIYNCWRSLESDNIMIGNSSRLASDIITNFPLLSVPANSWRHGVKYSLLVRQYALSRDAFNYLENVKKTTEEVGSLFGPQPANVEGNIRCITNPGEPVVGFFNVSTLTQKRIFINPAELPEEWHKIRTRNFSGECYFVPTDTVLMADLLAEPERYLLLNPIVEAEIIGYTTHNSRACIDCRRGGGINVKPDYWE